MFAFERLRTLADSKDFLLISAIFHTSVIRYAKPFLASEGQGGRVKYPIKHLKNVQGFSPDVHHHLLAVRNTLIAHDDFNKIEPRILLFGVQPKGTDFSLPTSLIVANKCISHPADTAAAQKFYEHAKAAYQGAMNKLHADLTELRTIALKHPDQAKAAEKYSKNYGTVDIAVEGTHLMPPDFSSDSWLNNEEPDFSSVHNGFRYESLRLRLDFHGPEEIPLPGGGSFVVTPPDTTASAERQGHDTHRAQGSGLLPGSDKTS